MNDTQYEENMKVFLIPPLMITIFLQSFLYIYGASGKETAC